MELTEAPVDHGSFKRRIGVGLVAFSAVVVLVGLVALWWLPQTAQSVDRVQRDHGVALPESARDIQAMGDMIRLVDHGLSAVFVIDSADLADFTTELDRVPDAPFLTFIPGNSQYQPSETPWPPDARPSRSFSKLSPAGGDFMHVEIYQLDPSRVGVWIYSDWN